MAHMIVVIFTQCCVNHHGPSSWSRKTSWTLHGLYKRKMIFQHPQCRCARLHLADMERVIRWHGQFGKMRKATWQGRLGKMRKA